MCDAEGRRRRRRGGGGGGATRGGADLKTRTPHSFVGNNIRKPVSRKGLVKVGMPKELLYWWFK